jgi:hypothetical protein
VAEPSTTAPVSHSAVPTLPHNRIEAANLHVAVLDSSAASTAEEKAVVDAWMQYWQGAADSYYYYRPTEGFMQVARGTARSDVLQYLHRLKSDKQRVVGWVRDNVLRVTMNGETATLRDCAKNFTYTVDSESEPLTRPPPYYDMTGTLSKEQGRWTVTKQNSRELGHSCLS